MDHRTDSEFLRDLAERLMHIPVMYGVDQGDADRLDDIARKLEQTEEEECPSTSSKG